MVFGLFGRRKSRRPDPNEAYREALLRLADAARVRLRGASECPRSFDRLERAEEAVRSRRVELERLEHEIDARQEALDVLVESLEAERRDAQPLLARHRKAVDAYLRRFAEVEALLQQRRADARHATRSLEKEETRLVAAEETNDAARIEELRASAKRLRLAVLKGERALGELEDELEKLKVPEAGMVGRDAIHAQMRLRDREAELVQLRATTDEELAKLEEAANAKDEELAGAESFYVQARVLFAQDVYALDPRDPELAARCREVESLLPPGGEA